MATAAAPVLPAEVAVPPGNPLILALDGSTGALADAWGADAPETSGDGAAEL